MIFYLKTRLLLVLIPLCEHLCPGDVLYLRFDIIRQVVEEVNAGQILQLADGNGIALDGIAVIGFLINPKACSTESVLVSAQYGHEEKAWHGYVVFVDTSLLMALVADVLDNVLVAVNRTAFTYI